MMIYAAAKNDGSSKDRGESGSLSQMEIAKAVIVLNQTFLSLPG